MSFTLYNLSTLMRRRSGTFFVTRCLTPRLSTWRLNLFFVPWRQWLVQHFFTRTRNLLGEDSILTALLLINGYLFFLHLNTGTMGKKAIRETVHVCCDWMCYLRGTLRRSTWQPHTHSSRGSEVCVAVNEERQKKLHCSISTHTGWNKTV